MMVFEFAHFCGTAEARKLPLNNLLAIRIEIYGEREKKTNEHRNCERGFTFLLYSSWVILANQITAERSFDRKKGKKFSSTKKFNKQNHFATHQKRM